MSAQPQQGPGAAPETSAPSPAADTPGEIGPAPTATPGPERIRALAHPVRLEILDYLGAAGEATATECARHTGQTVANCSFHLRTLAKYGFAEPAPARGRERPWRPAGRYDLRPDPTDPAAVRASGELSLVRLEHEMQRLRDFYSRAHEESPQWRRTASLSAGRIWATPEELAELTDQMLALTQPFLDREDPARRPPGARPASVFTVINPEPDQPGDSD